MPHWRTPCGDGGADCSTVAGAGAGSWLQSRSGGGRGDRRLREVLAVTPTQARRTQHAARARGAWLMWFVSYERTDRATARAVIADQHGGERLTGGLVAGTLPELRAMLPAGLTRWERASVMSLEVLEVWD